MGEPYVIENVCFVGSDESVDITIEQGRIADVRSSEKSVDKASKTWVIPGLWDCHTHFTQWSYTLGRLDLIDARSADEAMSLLREHLEERRESGTLDPDQYVVGMRFRHSLWADDAQPTLAAIDAVSGDQPVALSSADMHCGWVVSSACM
jgi:predicted amidohydrolase YtcJ